MQSNRSRVTLAVVAVAVAVVAFLVLRPSDDEEPASTPSASQEPAPKEEPGSEGGGAKPSDDKGPASGTDDEANTFRLEADGGEVAAVEVFKGEEVRLIVSADTEDEVHVHGYDEFADVAPGEPAEIEFTADIEGIYEVELEGSHTQIARLEVRP